MHAAGARSNPAASADGNRGNHHRCLTPAGGNAGLGRETVRVLASAGAHVVFTTRSAERGQQVAKELAAGGLRVCQLPVTLLRRLKCSSHLDSRRPGYTVTRHSAACTTGQHQRAAAGPGGPGQRAGGGGGAAAAAAHRLHDSERRRHGGLSPSKAAVLAAGECAACFGVLGHSDAVPSRHHSTICGTMP